jgi:ABC-2 type transport system permease protein
MKINIFQHEFRVHLRSAISWSLSLVAIIVIFMSMYSSFSDQAALMDEMLANFPPELLAAFGMSGLNMSSVLGFFGLIFLFVQICLAIQSANYGFGLVSIEESELTADFLITKPVSRSHILNSKLLAALAVLLLTDLVVWATAFGAVEWLRADNPYDAGILLLLLLSMLPFQLFFLSVGLLVSLLVKRVRSVTPYALGLGFGMYALSAFTDIGDVSALELITPFKHFDANHIIRQGTYDLSLVSLSLAVIAFSLVASYWLYLRRDIRAVV